MVGGGVASVLPLREAEDSRPPHHTRSSNSGGSRRSAGKEDGFAARFFKLEVPANTDPEMCGLIGPLFGGLAGVGGVAGGSVAKRTPNGRDVDAGACRESVMVSS